VLEDIDDVDDIEEIEDVGERFLAAATDVRYFGATMSFLSQVTMKRTKTPDKPSGVRFRTSIRAGSVPASEIVERG